MVRSFSGRRYAWSNKWQYKQQCNEVQMYKNGKTIALGSRQTCAWTSPPILLLQLRNCDNGPDTIASNADTDGFRTPDISNTANITTYRQYNCLHVLIWHQRLLVQGLDVSTKAGRIFTATQEHLWPDALPTATTHRDTSGNWTQAGWVQVSWLNYPVMADSF